MQQWNEANITGTIQMCCHNFNGTNNRQKKATIAMQGVQCGQEYYSVDESTPAALHFLCPCLYMQLLAG
jgi:hypothetical protein